jgi:pimeloyl-ACP methyl ester carboxylesterase
MRAIWIVQKNLPDRIAALSSRGVHFEIDGSGHYIQLDRPSAVISAVDEVVDQARYSAHHERSSANNVP